MSTTIREVFQGNVVRFLQETLFIDLQLVEELHQQFCRLSGTEKEIMFILATRSQPLDYDQLTQEIGGSVIQALQRLQERSMIEKTTGGEFTLQPLVMKHVMRHEVKNR